MDLLERHVDRLAPVFLFLAPGRERWAWEFTPIVLGITAHHIAAAALGAYAWLMLWLWIVVTDDSAERS